jgi:hypothetical protein
MKFECPLGSSGFRARIARIPVLGKLLHAALAVPSPYYHPSRSPARLAYERAVGRCRAPGRTPRMLRVGSRERKEAGFIHLDTGRDHEAGHLVLRQLGDAGDRRPDGGDPGRGPLQQRPRHAFPVGRHDQRVEPLQEPEPVRAKAEEPGPVPNTELPGLALELPPAGPSPRTRQHHPEPARSDSARSRASTPFLGISWPR